MSHIPMSDLHIKGYAEKNFPTPMTKPPRVPGGPTHPPPTPCRKTLILNFGAKIQIYGAKIQIFSAKTQICSSQTQICGAKNQIFDPKFKSINFCTTKNLPPFTRKTPNPSGLSPTHPTLGASKKLKCIPLATYKWETHIDMSHVIMIYIYIIYVGNYDMTHFYVGLSFVSRWLIDMWFIMTWVTSSWSLIYESCLNDLHVNESRHNEPHINEPPICKWVTS